MKYIKTLDVEVDTAELVYGRDPNELVDFIIDIDEKAANWDLTVKLYEHFSSEYDKYLMEQEDLKEGTILP